MYEKEGWVTTKSNVISIGDEDRTDLAIQFIDPLYYRYAVNPMVESLLGSIAGSPQTLERAIVTTVGKSWASIYHRQTHGVPGAQALLLSDATVDPIGPVYFNDRSQPDPSQAATSRDGGVCWFNPADGAYSITVITSYSIHYTKLYDFLSSAAIALETGMAPERMIMDHWDDLTGLPSNNVLDVLQDGAGYMWLASYDGLIRVITSYSIHYTKLYDHLLRVRRRFNEHVHLLPVGLEGYAVAGRVNVFHG